MNQVAMKETEVNENEQWTPRHGQGEEALKQMETTAHGLVSLHRPIDVGGFKRWIPYMLKKQKQGYIPLNIFGDRIGLPSRPYGVPHPKIKLGWVLLPEQVDVSNLIEDENGDFLFFTSEHDAPWSYQTGLGKMKGLLSEVFGISHRISITPDMRGMRGCGV